MTSRSLLAAAALVGLGFALGQVVSLSSPYPDTVEDVLAFTRDSRYPKPCLYNHLAATVAYDRQEDILANQSDEPYDVVPVGFERGAIIPKDCFAVQVGLFGTVVQYWEQPRTGVQMPVWNEMDQDSLPDEFKTPLTPAPNVLYKRS